MDYEPDSAPTERPFTRWHRVAWWKAHDFLFDGGDYEIHINRDGWPGTFLQLRSMIYREAEARGVKVSTSTQGFDRLRVWVPELSPAPTPEKSPLAKLRDERLAQEVVRRQQEAADRAACTCGQYPICAPSCFIATGRKPAAEVQADTPGHQDREPEPLPPGPDEEDLLLGRLQGEELEALLAKRQRARDIAAGRDPSIYTYDRADSVPEPTPGPEQPVPRSRILSQEDLKLMFPALNLGQQAPEAQSP
jgi:hypothetical protein